MVQFIIAGHLLCPVKTFFSFPLFYDLILPLCGMLPSQSNLNYFQTTAIRQKSTPKNLFKFCDFWMYSVNLGVLMLYTSGPVSLKERLLYTLNKLFVKQVKSFLLLLDLDPFILQCSLHNIKYIKFTSP